MHSLDLVFEWRTESDGTITFPITRIEAEEEGWHKEVLLHCPHRDRERNPSIDWRALLSQSTDGVGRRSKPWAPVMSSPPMTATSQNVSIVQHPGKLQWVGGAAAGIWVGPVARKTPLLVEFVALIGGFSWNSKRKHYCYPRSCDGLLWKNRRI